jgi:predicted transposase YdaD
MVFKTYAERVGERRGYKKGMRIGELEGRLEGKREGVLRLLQVRFRRVPKRVVVKVSELTDFALLTELFDAAARCASLKEFESQLPAK